MKQPEWAVNLKTNNPRVYYSGLTLFVIIIVINAVLFALLIKTDPRQISAGLETLILVTLALAISRVSDRVSKLERATSASGGFTALVTDAKAAAKLAGNTEEQANAVANEVLATCVRKAGGWQP